MEATLDLLDEVEEQRTRLLHVLSDQRRRVSMLWDWYRGRQDLPDVPAKYAAAYQLFLDHATTPWARLVVDAIAERLRVQGFHAGDDVPAAERAWAAFVRSRMNADQRLVYVEALIGGTGYVSVARNGGGEVRMVPESAMEVTHEADPASRQTVAGALKMYPLDQGHRNWVCELYRPEATFRWYSELKQAPRAAGAFPIDAGIRMMDLAWEELDPLPNDVGVVPVVPFENRINVMSGGASEIEDCIGVLQRIDRLTLDKMLTSYYGSFRQKWATGLQVPTDPDTGKKVEPFKAAVDRVWVNPSPDGSFGTFESSDITQYLAAIDSEIATLAAISRVPAHYLLQRNLANPPSAESLIASETGLVAKVEDRQASYGEAWEQCEWLRARMEGSPIEIQELEVHWMDAEKRNPAQVADSAIKLAQIGVPHSALWEWVGFTPQQVAQFELENAAQALLAAATQPQLQPPQEGAGAPAAGV